MYREEMREMAVVNKITAAIEEKEAVMVKLPVEEAVTLPVTRTRRKRRKIPSGNSAKNSSHPVGAT